MALRLRALTAEEARASKRLAQSRTGPVRRVERAQIIWRARHTLSVPAMARGLGVGAATVRLWLTRCHAAGLAGLADQPRSGRPATSPPAQVGAVVAAALAKPDERGRHSGPGRWIAWSSPCRRSRPSR